MRVCIVCEFTAPKKELTWNKIIVFAILSFMAAILFLSGVNIQLWDSLSTEIMNLNMLNTHVSLFTLRPFSLMHFENILM